MINLTSCKVIEIYNVFLVQNYFTKGSDNYM